MGFRLGTFKAVLFDMDGSLVDSMWMWKNIDAEFLEKRGIPYLPEFQREIEGMSYSETVRHFKERFSTKESEEELSRISIGMAIDKYEHEVTYKPGAFEFLLSCEKAGIPCGIATSNSRPLVDACNRNLNLSRFCKSIRTTDEVERSKPYPDIYLLVAKDLGVKAEDCIVFEDILPGIQAGKNAGMRVIAVQDDYSRDIEKEKRELSDYFIEDYRELLL